MSIPSRTSRWYESRYHRTCRSSDLSKYVSIVSWKTAIQGGQGRLTSGGRLAGIDVADNDDVDVSLVFLTVVHIVVSIAIGRSILLTERR